MVGEYDNALGTVIRAGVPVALIYAAYLVAFCPCKTMLACDTHSSRYFYIMMLAMLAVVVHIEYGSTAG
jgi:TctA family transporter